MGGESTKKVPLLKDEEIKRCIKESQDGNQSARDYIVEHNLKLVWSVVQRFLSRGYEPEDLFQIGCIGLMKSIDKFDLSYDVKFSTYAVPMIIGEIQRFIRDDGTVKVSRSLKESANRIRKAKEEWMRKWNRQPTISELAATLNMSPEDLVMAQESVRPTASLYEQVYEQDGDPITLMDQIADKKGSGWFDQLALKGLIEELPERDRLIVYLRYYKDQTQSEVADRLGISQVQVSRLEKKILETMKESMSG
jgi:RNA polymerase sporulation-specific sigma factor